MTCCTCDGALPTKREALDLICDGCRYPARLCVEGCGVRIAQGFRKSDACRRCQKRRSDRREWKDRPSRARREA